MSLGWVAMGGPSGGAGNPLAAIGSLPEHTRVWLGWVLKNELLAQEEFLSL